MISLQTLFGGNVFWKHQQTSLIINKIYIDAYLIIFDLWFCQYLRGLMHWEVMCVLVFVLFYVCSGFAC